MKIPDSTSYQGSDDVLEKRARRTLSGSTFIRCFSVLFSVIIRFLDFFLSFLIFYRIVYQNISMKIFFLSVEVREINGKQLQLLIDL